MKNNCELGPTIIFDTLTYFAIIGHDFNIGELSRLTSLIV